MQKLPVNGAFTEIVLSGSLESKKSLGALLGQIEAEISLNKKEKIHTGNPARDETLFNSFFSLFKKKAVLNGTIDKVSGDDLKGEFFLNLSMNEKTLAVPMAFTRDDQGAFVAKGAIDVNDFALAGALASLHKSCEVLHKGTDGVSKTWSTVELVLAAKITKTCK